ncbi:CiaD-like domain-containing protein [Nautilia sp.]
MDLKETILETLQEIESGALNEEDSTENSNKCDEEFLKHIKERILVLFEGLQSPNTENLDVKLDVTLNFLEYLLVKIDEKLKK